MADPTQSFKDELSKTIERRKKYEGWDFKLSHAFIWLSILASFSSSIIIAHGVKKKHEIWISVISGIPGLIVIIDKTFDFARRTAWGTMYKIDLQKLKDKVDFKKIDIYEASKELRELNRRHESSFLKIGFLARHPKKKPSNEKEKGT